MGLFKTKITLADFVKSRTAFLLSADREEYWEVARAEAGDRVLANVPRDVYHANMRGAYLQLLGVSVMLRGVNVATQLLYGATMERALADYPQLRDLYGLYNSAYGSDPDDGLRGMVRLFDQRVANGSLRPETRELLYYHFVAVEQKMLAEIKALRLVYSEVDSGVTSATASSPPREAGKKEDDSEVLRSLTPAQAEAFQLHVARMVYLANQAGKATETFLADAGVKVEAMMWVSVVFEYLYLYLTLTARALEASMPESARVLSLFHRLVEMSIDVAVEGMCRGWGYERIKRIQAEVMENFTKAFKEYSGYSLAPPEQGKAAGTLLWEFAKGVSARLGREPSFTDVVFFMRLVDLKCLEVQTFIESIKS
jgi:hypothetical protein